MKRILDYGRPEPPDAWHRIELVLGPCAAYPLVFLGALYGEWYPAHAGTASTIIGSRRRDRGSNVGRFRAGSTGSYSSIGEGCIVPLASCMLMVRRDELPEFLALAVRAPVPVQVIDRHELLKVLARPIAALAPMLVIWRHELVEVTTWCIAAAVPMLMIWRDELAEILARRIGTPAPVLVVGCHEPLEVPAGALGAALPVLMVGRHRLLVIAAAGLVAPPRRLGLRHHYPGQDREADVKSVQYPAHASSPGCDDAMSSPR